MNNSGPQLQAVENALKGERTFQQLAFATTGDHETDLISAIVAAVGACQTDLKTSVRVLQYLSKRYLACASDWKSLQAEREQFVGQAISNPMTCPDPFTPYVPPNLAAGISKTEADWEKFRGH